MVLAAAASEAQSTWHSAALYRPAAACEVAAPPVTSSVVSAA